ncbi:uncharacterized protein LOC106636997 [Copidosoma floridanum]|uniref:uncharacterized protein LOC106636997 n=1 Tax=Copidosoma floridanum TaxID=29053 RepID=UPI0006C94F5F|nr:uncharacterized protein LOC106636997 [Copidosoma floridanum]
MFRRRKIRNSSTDLKTKTMDSSCMDYCKELKKNKNQTTCSSASPLPGCASTSLSLSATQGLGSSNSKRPRSLYTAHTYQGQYTEESEFRTSQTPSWHCHEPAGSRLHLSPQRLAEFDQHLIESLQPSKEQWSQLSAGFLANIPAILWRQQQHRHHRQYQYPQSTKYLGFSKLYPSKETCGYTESLSREHEPKTGLSSAIVTSHGTISLWLHNEIRLDITIDRAVRIINLKNNIVLSLSGSGSASALLHPNGRIYQYGSRVEILAHDVHRNNKYAKMWYKGVSFTSEQCALVYLVDAAGARTTTDTFSDMSQDFSVNVFYAESRHGPTCVPEATAALSAAQFWTTDEGVENWIINNVRISQTLDGLVRIARNSNKYQLRTSPSNGTASLTTPFLHCTASLGQTPHLFVRRGERRMHYDGTSFIVRNAGHSAGFDDNNQLKVF